jgi:hypothetical protein
MQWRWRSDNGSWLEDSGKVYGGSEIVSADCSQFRSRYMRRRWQAKVGIWHRYFLKTIRC